MDLRHRAKRNIKMNEATKYEKTWIKTVSVALGIMGIINIISAWFSYDSLRFKFIKNIFDYQLIHGSRYLVVMTGIVAILIAPNLYRQKRIAWYISIFLLAVSGIAHIVKGADIEEASLCILLLGVLMPLYRYFYVKSDPLRVQRSGKILLGSIIFVLFYTFIGLHFFATKLGINSNLSVWNTGLNTLLFDVSGLHPQNLAAKFFSDSILLVNSFAIFVGLTLALSPVIVRTLPDVNLKKYKKNAQKYAIQSVQIFSLEKEYMHFGQEGDSGEYLSYKVADGVAMAIGNPCVISSSEIITDGWINFANEHDWIPAAYQVQDEFFNILKNRGFHSIPIGAEALIELETFTLEGKDMQELRSAKNRAEKENWVIREYLPSDWEKIRNLDRKWLKIHGGKENSFAMGKSSRKYLSETRTILLLDKDNNLLAYLNNIELPGNNSRAVDLMRRDPENSNKGVMEALFLHEILQAQSEGKKYYDLGFSPLAEMDKSLADNKVALNLLTLIYEKQKRYYDFQGLHHFKAKFRPIWKPSFLVYPSQVTLPKVLLALLNLNKTN